jgi:hypothetical protein
MGRYITRLVVILLCTQSYLTAWDDTPNCFKKIEEEIFNQRNLDQTFSMHLYYMNQGSWNILYKLLRDQTHDLHQKLRKAGNQFERNPFDHPFQPKAALNLLHDTLFIGFERVMRENNVNSAEVITSMFDEIWRKQAGRLAECLHLAPSN